MKIRKITNVLGFAILGWLLGTGAVLAQTDLTWRGENGSPANSWSDGLNWVRTTGAGPWSPVPPVADTIVTFDNGTNTRAITVGVTPVAAGTLRFSGVTITEYTIGGASETSQPIINLSNQTSLIEVLNGSVAATVNARIGVVGDSVSRSISNAGTTGLNLAGGVSFLGTGNHTLTVGGTGNVSLGNLSTASNSTLNVVRGASPVGSLALNGNLVGNVTVSSNATVTGNVVASGGNLVVNGTVANLTVGNGSVLSGTGTIGTATIASGGQHNAGINPGIDLPKTPGLQTFTNLTYNSGSTFVWELTGEGTSRGVDFDAVDVTNLTIDTGAVSRLVIGSSLLNNTTFWSSNRSWQVFSPATTISGSFTIDTSQVSSLSSLGTFSWNGGTLSFAAVPEPGTLALLGVASTVGFGVMRFRRKKSQAQA